MTDEFSDALSPAPDGDRRAARRRSPGRRRAGSPAPRHARPRRRRVVLPAVAGVLTAALVLPVGYAAYNYSRFDRGVTRLDAIPAPTGTATPDDVDGEAMNVLLVGDDHRPDGASPEVLAKLGTEDDGGATNTDTMIVLHVAGDGRSATMISLPRDSYVEIPGHGTDKLNAAFAYGERDGGGPAAGAQLLISTVQDLTGLTIDHFVRVSLLGFYDIVDTLGPVDVCLNQPVQDRWSGLDLPAGESTLDAQQALAFVRQRHGLPNGDLDRQVRQQYFLTVEAERLLSAGTLLNPVKLGSVLDAVSGSLETDAGLDPLALARQMRHLRPAEIRSATIPITGTPTITVRGRPLSIVEVDHAAMPAFVAQLLGPSEEFEAATAAAPADVTVQVLNGSGATGAAGTATEALGSLGFATTEPGSAGTTSVTTVQYPAGQEARAKAVVAAVPGATAVQSVDVTTVTLVLGTDGVAVPLPAPSAEAGTGTDADAGTEAGAGSPATGTDPAQEPAAPATPARGGTSYAEVRCIN